MQYISIVNSEETTKTIMEETMKLLDSKDLKDYIPLKETHITVAHVVDIKKHKINVKEYIENFNNKYYDKIGTKIPYTIDKIAFDEKCVTAVVLSDNFPIEKFPTDKHLHVTLMLNNCKPVYSNELISKTKQEDFLYFPSPLTLEGILTIVK